MEHISSIIERWWDNFETQRRYNQAMNHYDLALNDLIEHIKADKGIVQPWRNYCIKHLMEAQAHICKGLSTTNRVPAEGKVGTNYPTTLDRSTGCTCPEGGKRKDCPVHGGVSRSIRRPVDNIAIDL